MEKILHKWNSHTDENFLQHREARGLTATGKKSRGMNKGHRYNNTKAGRRHTWKRQNTQSYWRYR
jgi:large subunit ribosomal protein L15e